MSNNGKTNSFVGRCYTLNGKSQTIPIEGAAEDAAQNGGRRKNVVKGDYNNNNFNGEVVNNFDGVAAGNIFRGENAIEKSDNAMGSIICDETRVHRMIMIMIARTVLLVTITPTTSMVALSITILVSLKPKAKTNLN